MQGELKKMILLYPHAKTNRISKFKEFVVTRQYPVEAQCEVQSQAAENEAAMNFLAANGNVCVYPTL